MKKRYKYAALAGGMAATLMTACWVGYWLAGGPGAATGFVVAAAVLMGFAMGYDSE